VTAFAALIVTVQVLVVPVQAPDQPLKVDPAVTAAVKVTLLFWLKLAAQVAPQLMPAGELVTVPAPVPDLVTVSCTGTAEKLAVTAFAALIVTVQVLAVPVHDPDQPLKVDPAVATAVKMTLLFLLKLAAQVAPQLMPAGELVTVPAPVPDLEIVSCTGIAAKLAVTALAALMVTTQVVAVPVQAPVQPLKVEPAVAVAVRVTEVFCLNLTEQVVPQLIPAGALVTVPPPVPVLVTVKTLVGVKLAVTLLFVVMTTVQDVAVPVQATDQPLKVEPAAGVAVSTMLGDVLAYDALQVVPQLMAAGLLVTVPLPVPVFVTVSVPAAYPSIGIKTRPKSDHQHKRLTFDVDFIRISLL
jgi:hypothetical protein